MPDNTIYQRVTRKNEGGKGLNFGLKDILPPRSIFHAHAATLQLFLELA